MVPSFKYWNSCVDPPDMEALWMDPKVRTEWINAGETKGQKVHLSRGHDGQPYLTQTEMKAVAGIIVGRHFVSQIDPDMICAIAELESDRQPTATRYNKKTKQTSVGIMQILPETADWLVRELGYRAYDVQGHSEVLYRPFINVYLGAAYLKWLSNYDQKERSEEFIVRAYKGGTKKATHKSTLQFWSQYLSVKGRLLYSEVSEVGPIVNGPSASATSVQDRTGSCGNYFFKTTLCTLAEIISMRFVHGVAPRPGIMGIDYSTARWLYKDLGYKAYMVQSVDDLTRPFVSMYFGAAYLAWLSQYEGRERTTQFVVQAYLAGPKNVNLQETGPLWLKFEETLRRFGDMKK